jgi:methyltransferase (TIGR00027 family)
LGYLEVDKTVRCADYLAADFLDSEWKDSLRFRSTLIRRLEKNVPGIYYYGLARTRFFDSMLAEAIEAGTRQVLIMGAGFDSRAYRFDADHPILFVEFDRLNLHRTKISRVAASDNITTNNTVVSIPVDFTRSSIVDLLLRLDLDYTRPLTILAEGLLYYMQKSFFDSLLGFLSNSCALDSRIIFDYLCEDNWSMNHNDEAASTRASEPLIFSLSHEVLTEQIRGAGMEIHMLMDQQVMNSEYLTDSTGTSVGLPLVGFNLCCARKIT